MRSTLEACWIPNMSFWALARGSYIHSGQRMNGASSSPPQQTHISSRTEIAVEVGARTGIPCDHSGSGQPNANVLVAATTTGERKVITSEAPPEYGEEYKYMCGKWVFCTECVSVE